MKILKTYLFILILPLLTIQKHHLNKKDYELKSYKNLIKNLITGKVDIKGIQNQYQKQKRKLLMNPLEINPLEPLGFGKKGDQESALAGWVTTGTALALGGYGIYKLRSNQTKHLKKLNLIIANKQRILLEMQNDKDNKMDLLNKEIEGLKTENDRMFDSLKRDIDNLMNAEVEENDEEVHEIKKNVAQEEENDRLLMKAEKIMLEKLKKEKLEKLKKEKLEKLKLEKKLI